MIQRVSIILMLFFSFVAWGAQNSKRDATVRKALKAGTVEACGELVSKDGRPSESYLECVTALALEKGDPSQCDAASKQAIGTVPSDHWVTPARRCVYSVVETLADSKGCSRLSEKTEQDGCVERFQRVAEWRTRHHSDDPASWRSKLGKPGFPPIHSSECSSAQGHWIGADLPGIGHCEFSVSDVGKRCEDNRDCESRFCQYSKINSKPDHEVGLCTGPYPDFEPNGRRWLENGHSVR